MTVLAVTKAHPPEAVRAAYAAGCRDFGESYVQEALPKIAALADLPLTWHYIGHVQTNKVRDIARHFAFVHGVDRLRVAEALAQARPESLAPLDVCIQVNISGEATKGGTAPADASALAHAVSGLPRLRLRGLMGMASATRNVAGQRAQFALLRRVRDAIVGEGIALDTLSMGMSDDFEAAVAEGATMVRIGTAIFGSRPGRGAAPSAAGFENAGRGEDKP